MSKKLLTICLISEVLCAVYCLYSDFHDLSYSYSGETIFFPGQKEFNLSKDYEGWRDNNSWYAAYSFCMGEHGGTHLDAPFHFYKPGWTVEQIPPEHLIDVQGVIINIEENVQNAENPGNYTLTVQDIIQHERKYGYPIPSKSLVLVFTGWSKYWGNKAQYLGIKNTGDEKSLSFPGISEESAKWLYNERSIVGIGIDTASVDPGFSKTYPVHDFLASKQVYNLENVANLHLLTDKQIPISKWASNLEGNCISLKFFVLPLKIIGGTGSPVRILSQCKN